MKFQLKYDTKNSQFSVKNQRIIGEIFGHPPVGMIIELHAPTHQARGKGSPRSAGPVWSLKFVKFAKFALPNDTSTIFCKKSIVT